MHRKPAKYLVLIDAAGEMLARLFDAERRQVADFDASSEEVAVMISGLTPNSGAAEPEWDAALAGHSFAERELAQVFALDV
ncbi:hypothetical protein [Caldimonas sp. KR1-144]|uniref:hypothetical protein n=1 Tax=Caldimonas sp. KR1-144 TaxID=3400911 RepID=UPI003C04F888